MSGEENGCNEEELHQYLKDKKNKSPAGTSMDEDFTEEMYESSDEYEVDLIPEEDFSIDELSGELSFSEISEEEDDRHFNEQIDEENDGCTHTRAIIRDE